MAHTQRSFEEQPSNVKAILVVVAPAVLGALSGLALGFSGIAYWILQVIAILGAVIAGTECRGLPVAAIRSLIAGAIFGACILIVRTMLDRPDQAHVSGASMLPLTAAIGGLVLGLIGWALVGRKRGAVTHTV